MSSVYNMEQMVEKVYNYIEGIDESTNIHLLPNFTNRLVQGKFLKNILPELTKEEFTPLESFAVSLLALHLVSLGIITLREKNGKKMESK